MLTCHVRNYAKKKKKRKGKEKQKREKRRRVRTGDPPHRHPPFHRGRPWRVALPSQTGVGGGDPPPIGAGVEPSYRPFCEVGKGRATPTPPLWGQSHPPLPPYMGGSPTLIYLFIYLFSPFFFSFNFFEHNCLRGMLTWI